ncbi:NDP-hexose 3-C-methyltransferase protein [Beggiatoa sp. PS]|nr:NDP-hexose 3-C-methyltransferase protein [Beggiatoa sp. PS]
MIQNCRFCGTTLKHTFCDLGMSPLSNAYLKSTQLHLMEAFYPLHAYVCENCYLVQLQEFQSPDKIFSDYAYFSSYSETWLKHAQAYTEYMIERFGFNTSNQIIEIASNDGYLLQYFKEKNISILGVEPAENVAKVAQTKGIPTITKFFGIKTATELANEGKQANLLLGNNVLAHVPDINDFVAGMKILLKPNGVITMEFPHLLRLMEQNQFDTIYHEHFSYLSFITVESIFAKHGLTIFDVEELTTHGGSLRIFAKHSEDNSHCLTDNVNQMKQFEKQQGLNNISTYQKFAKQVQNTKRNILDFLIQKKREGKTLVGYGAPAKGNTLLNYCGIRSDFIDYTVDRSPHKQGLFLPGTHIAIHNVDKIKETKPDYVIILPWNLKAEIMEQMAHIREWGSQFITLIPQVEVIS